MVLKMPSDVSLRTRSNRARFLISLLFMLMLALTALGCIKSRDVVKLPQQTPIAVAYVMDDDHEGLVGEVPQVLKDEVNKVLAERNLNAFEIPFATYSQVFVPVRDSKKRLSRLSNGEADFTLLIETKAIYFAQLSGRYRWTVDLKFGIAAKDNAIEPMFSSSEQSAFVDFEHQKEPQVIESIADDLARRVGAQLDEFLSAVSVAEKKN